MARTVNYPKRAEKIKEMIDDLVKEMGHSPHRMSKYNRQNEKYEFPKRKVQKETFEYYLKVV